MEHTQLLRVKKLKGGGIITNAARHNLREIQAEIGADSHIDIRKTCQNVILRGAANATEVAQQATILMEQARVKPLRKDAVRGLEALVSLPASSGIAERQFFDAVVVWAEKYFEVPILSAVIHNDEAAPHCHVIMLPLFDGRMIGSGLIGNKAKLLVMQTDFFEKVGQGFGLMRGAPAKRYGGAARTSAADRVVRALRKSPDSLDNPAIRDALRDAIAATMPVSLLELLGLDMPAVKTPKPKTFAGIMTKRFKPEKPIGFTPPACASKDQSLSCVGFGGSSASVSPVSRQIQDEYIRVRDSEQTAGCWNYERGEHEPNETANRAA